ncbi:MAG: helix-turn-helix transcriptional regulator [Hyphomonas sp.]|jgi:transcriptional regulator with XRE-family HTH domain|nr:helix-turn-helix transcriptional regulator [Hyphomonas sp.]
MSTAKFDGEGFFTALDAERQSRKLTWKKVAEQAAVPASTLTRISQGRRPDVDTLAALCQWSGLDADKFTRPRSKKDTEASPLAQITIHLRADRNLSKEGVQALEAIIKAAYEQFRKS